ncbi:MAG TPA: hypothetical protein VJ735_14920 [Actinomycetes bacterium]|nr:hypothetical protein [Actinomycetes bacterium]
MAVTSAESIMAEGSTKATANRWLLCPFDLQVWTVDRMLNFEIENDPDYQGLELQVFDDPAHGQGMAVLVRRRADGRIDIYRQPGLTLDPGIAQVGGELGEWLETPIDPARFAISPDGVDVDVRFTDVAGRVIQVRIDDRDGRPRHRGTLLAPVGAIVEDPVSLPLFLMGGCDLVRRSGSVFDIRIDGRRLVTGRLPGGWLHRRRLVKYTADPTVVICNQAYDGPIAVGPRAPGDVELAPRTNGIAALRARNGGHRARLELAPALPDLVRLRPQMTIEGTWRLGVDDDPAVVSGAWTLERHQDRAGLVLHVDQGWRPARLPPLMTAVTRLAPVFRSWPTTYRWSGTVTLGDQPTLTSRWERTGGQRDESYRRLTTARTR